MEYIKEFVKNNDTDYHIIIRTETYAKSLGHFMDMFNELQKDFPSLLEEETRVEHYAGDRYKRTYGLEFNSKTVPPEKYKEIAGVEFTL